MAEGILITCSACGKQMKVPDSVAGKKIRCTGCKGAVPVPTGKGKSADTRLMTPEAQKRLAAAREEEGIARDPYAIEEISVKPRCPFCAHELESEEARICLNCGYDMVQRGRVESKKVFERTSGDFLMWHLPTLGCILGMVAIVLFLLYYHYWLPGVVLSAENATKLANDRWAYFEDEQADWTGIMFHWGIQCWLIVAGLFGFYKCGSFAFRRLVFHFLPEERKKIVKD